MSKVIDLRLDFPPSQAKIADLIKTFILDKEGRGVANYRHIFGPQWAAAMGTTIEKLEQLKTTVSEHELEGILKELAGKLTVSLDQFKSQLDAADIEWGLIDGRDNDETAQNVTKLPERLKGMAVYNPFEGENAVTELERAVQVLEFKAVYASPYRWGIRANDPKFYPCYETAAALDIPVFIYAAMNYRTDYPMDLGRPLYLDRVAMDFPGLRIVASCGGWPWVPELIGVARRHQNVYIDISSHRPRYIAVKGSGFEMLLQFGNTLLQDRVVFASGAGDLGLPLDKIVQEIRELPLKDEVRKKWLYKNACRLFKME